LQEIHHKKPGGATLSKFDYTYDAGGNILTWVQQTDTNPAQTYSLEYDRADELTAATLAATTPKRYRYGYDAAGNRTAEQIDDVVTSASYDNMNRLVSQQPGGSIAFRGTLSEPATVTVGGTPAAVTSSNTFSGSAPAPSGTSTVVVAATDSSGNTRTNTYQVSETGTSKTFTYDPNGNLTGDGTKTYEWDAENRLVAINQGTLRSEFTYDGGGRRTRIVEKNNSVVTADRRFVFDGIVPSEERDAANAVVKRFFAGGFQEGGVTFYWVEDHLGSVRDVTDSSGTLRARYDYDPFGRRTKISGDVDTDFGFTGHFFHAMSGLHLSTTRALDSSLGRWISEDPKADSTRTEGPNRYAYVSNDPIAFRDPLGLEKVAFTITTVIREGLSSMFQPGVKTRHMVTADTDTGKWVYPPLWSVGETAGVGQGVGTHKEDVSGGGGSICISMSANARSKALPAFTGLDISYDFKISYNAGGHGLLKGSHDGYPSYEIQRNTFVIYNWNQGWIGQLGGQMEIQVNRPF
jgi:RHS repeat-associated protein